MRVSIGQPVASYDATPIIPPPDTVMVGDKKVVLWTADKRPITRKVGF